MKEVTIIWTNRNNTKIIVTTPNEVLRSADILSEEPDVPAIGITPEYRKDQFTARQNYFISILKTIKESKEIVIFGSDNTKEELLDFINEHDSDLFSKIIGVEASLEMPEEKIIARGRKYI